MADRRVYLSITSLHCSANSTQSYDLETSLLLGPSLMLTRRKITFEAASVVSIAIAVDKCEACADQKAGGHG